MSEYLIASLITQLTSSRESTGIPIVNFALAIAPSYPTIGLAIIGCNVVTNVIWPWFKRPKQYPTAEIVSGWSEARLTNYMKAFPQFFTPFQYQHDIGNDSHLLTNQRVGFNDKNFNVRGEIVTYSTTREVAMDHVVEKRETVHTQVVVWKGMAPHQYLKEVENHIEMVNEQSQSIAVMGCTLCDVNHAQGDVWKNHILYEGAKSTDDRRRQYLDSFFHPQKDEIFELLLSITECPELFREMGQIPTANILLHGPPGTGKSSLAYRLAMISNTTLKVVDLKLLQTKSDLYSIFSSLGSRAIFLLEEIDDALNFIADREKYLTRLMSECDISDRKEKESETAVLTRDIKIITLKDILEVFQGAIYPSGRIIIATTNHYDKIEALCPALFRYGRLVPFYMGYLDADHINKMLIHCFGKECAPVINFNPEITTAEITSHIMIAKKRKNPQVFLDRMNRHRPIV